VLNVEYVGRVCEVSNVYVAFSAGRPSVSM
jgi:hypothetical protein